MDSNGLVATASNATFALQSINYFLSFIFIELSSLSSKFLY